MMKRKTWACGAVAALMVVGGLLVGSPSPAMADQVPGQEVTPYWNDSNTTFKFDLASGGHGYEDYRRKDNDSSVYIWIQGYSGAPLRLYVDGANSTSGKDKKNCTVGTYRSNHQGEWQMWNSVNEDRLHYARLTSWAEGKAGRVHGEWSPDCSNQNRYAVLPA